jgi:dephospho-CoA kinase
MKRIAIAGGIGAGKTVVTDRLLELGWNVIDADVIAHQVTSQRQPAWFALVDAFGAAILDSKGDVDRAFLADVVFHDATALRRLNHITHGHIGLEIIRQLDEAVGEAIFVALPLFRSEHREIFTLDEAWSVQVEMATAVSRLCEFRGYREEDAVARLAAQISNAERSAIVDHVLWNEGTKDELYEQLEILLGEHGLSHG